MREHPRIQRLCAWSGLAAIVTMAIGMLPLAKFVPPPPPSWSAAQTAHFFAVNHSGIRAGMIVCMVASTLLMPFVVAIFLQMRRIEGRHPALAYVQLGLGTLFVLEFIYLLFFWEVAAFRPARDVSQVLLLNDMGWVPYIGLSATFIMEIVVFGVAVLMDGRAKPIFPRWFGYYCILVGTCLTPGTFNVFFKHGILAWDGLLSFWEPILTFSVWMAITPYFLSKAVDHQLAEEADWAEPERLEAAITELRAELDRVAARTERLASV